MSKKTKSAASERRKKLKRDKKAAQKAKYEAFQKQGINSKSRRTRIRSRKSRALRSIRHRMGKCGNFGCIECNFAGAIPRIGHRGWIFRKRVA